ncbi:MAG: ATP phosphoribosyltransferase [Clostridia bacterium]|nr:ATP phosphoribosyltransferase [Clostridia bacterium]
MTINDSVLLNGEKVLFALRGLYASAGYRQYRMSKFEEYDFYAQNKDFLVSDQVITFTDTNGKLMALKPDVTLSIIKNSADTPEETRKIFYNENVYRVSKGTDSFREIMQTGVECFGDVGTAEICEVLSLAARSLRLLAPDALLVLSDLDVLTAAIDALALDGAGRKTLYRAIGEKNSSEIEKLCAAAPNAEAVKALKELLALSGPVSALQPKLMDRLEEGFPQFCAVLKILAESSLAEVFCVDFSLVGDVHYYNGVIFKGFLREVPTEVLSGGQYNRLMRRLGRKSGAIGFAVYTDLLDRIDLSEQKSAAQGDDYINIALPKGRLGEVVYDLFAKAGFECPSILEQNRKLIFENPEKRVRYFWVKPSDVPIYVERGAADIGVAGKDILLEYAPEVYELLDLKKGKCRMAVAAPKGFEDSHVGTLRVATKFSNIAKRYYQSQGRSIDIIHLNGSIEIAPILGLSDVIVDIVETGTTLKENDLEVFETVVPISARLIANKAAYKFKQSVVDNIAAALETLVEAEA